MTGLSKDRADFEKVFITRQSEVKRKLAVDLDRIHEELKRHIAHQKSENARIQQQIAQLQEEKIAFQDFLRGIREKLEDIERQVGDSS